MSNEVNTILKNFLLDAHEQQTKDFAELIGKMLNSNNKLAIQIRNLLQQNRFKDLSFEEKVFECITIIYLKKETILKKLNNGKTINSYYLYLTIRNALLDEININENEKIFSEMDNNSDEEGGSDFSDFVKDEKTEEEIIRIIEQDSVEKYFEFLKAKLDDNDFEALCYFLAKDKDGYKEDNPFLKDVKKTNTRDKKVSRVREKLKKIILKGFIRPKHSTREDDIWLKVFEKIWSEICCKRVYNGVRNETEENND